mmetsp:Transcript_59311/g.141011  ORF Transcript_59311/g.141011 Transcript_59311/m.141011 type:complete len:220 (+) Transcript_59311:81-740(+)
MAVHLEARLDFLLDGSCALRLSERLPPEDLPVMHLDLLFSLGPRNDPHQVVSHRHISLHRAKRLFPLDFDHLQLLLQPHHLVFEALQLVAAHHHLVLLLHGLGVELHRLLIHQLVALAVLVQLLSCRIQSPACPHDLARQFLLLGRGAPEIFGYALQVLPEVQQVCRDVPLLPSRHRDGWGRGERRTVGSRPGLSEKGSGFAREEGGAVILGKKEEQRG